MALWDYLGQYQKGKTNPDLLKQDTMPGNDISAEPYTSLHPLQT